MWRKKIIRMSVKVYIFGAGKCGKELLKELRNFKSVEVLAFVDNNVHKQGGKIDGIECISADEVSKRGGTDDVILVSPIHHEEIVRQLRQMNFTKIFCVGEWLQEWVQKQKYNRPAVFEETDFENACPFNHYESPYADILDIHRHDEELFDPNQEVKEIDFNVLRQLELARIMKDICLPEWSNKKNERYRYYYDNDYFMKGSADVLYYMMRIAEPKRIIEVGSGFSTAAMLDINENYFNNAIKIISIEPRPDRLKQLIKSADNIEVYKRNLQDISTDFFDILEENDILFIDSSHVSKMNSDVNYLLFEILPCLNKGVYIHFHDIFYPFIYPRQWVYEGRAYNEMYLLRAFLMNNNKYSIQFFGEMLNHKYKEELCDKLLGNSGGSIWIQKMFK